MSEIQNTTEEEEPILPKRNPVVWGVWNVMFVLMYPVLAVFSLLVMVLMFVSSGLSTILYKLIGLFKSK